MNRTLMTATFSTTRGLSGHKMKEFGNWNEGNSWKLIGSWKINYR